MGTVRKTRIVVPCYNEAKRLDCDAFLTALAHDASLSFLFVNDGSTDDTLTLLQRLKEGNPAQVALLCLEKNAGKAEAVRQGMLKALEGPFTYIGYWDADLATPLDTIASFCHVLDSTDAEVVIGARVRLLGRKVERQALRHYLGRVFATCASLLLGIPVYDTQCGAKIFRRNDALRHVFGKPFKVKWTFDVEMIARFGIVADAPAKDSGSRWFEYPLVKWVDVKGSKVKSSDFLKGALEFALLCTYLMTPLRRSYKKYLLENITAPSVKATIGVVE